MAKKIKETGKEVDVGEKFEAEDQVWSVEKQRKVFLLLLVVCFQISKEVGPREGAVCEENREDR